MCMCYQYQRASLSANETICFTRTKTLVIKVRYPAIINFSKSIYSSFRELWENTTKQIKNRPLKYFLDHVRSSKSDEFSIVLQETSTPEVFFVLLWHLLRFSTDARQLPSLNTPPKTPHTCTSVTTSVSWPSLTFLFHWPPYNETGHN